MVNAFSPGPGKVGTLGISRVLSLRSAENRAPGRVQIEDPGCGYGSPSSPANRATLSPHSPVSPGRHKCWPAQGPPDFCLEGVKEMWTLIYRLALHQRVEIPGMTFAQSCMRSVSANYAITDKFLESPTNIMGPGREQAFQLGLSD